MIMDNARLRHAKQHGTSYAGWVLYGCHARRAHQALAHVIIMPLGASNLSVQERASTIVMTSSAWCKIGSLHIPVRFVETGSLLYLVVRGKSWLQMATAANSDP